MDTKVIETYVENYINGSAGGSMPEILPLITFDITRSKDYLFVLISTNLE